MRGKIATVTSLLLPLLVTLLTGSPVRGHELDPEAELLRDLLSDAPVKGVEGGAVSIDSLSLQDRQSRNIRVIANVPRSTPAFQSDLAFWGTLAFAGSYDGFRVLDITSPRNPRVLADVRCRGQQGDVAVWKHLLIVSVDRPVTAPTCDGVDTPLLSPGPPARFATGFEGLRIFDVRDPRTPRLLAAVPTDCGSHTHTLVPDLAFNRLLVYVSSAFSTAFQGPTPFGTTCTNPHNKISIVEIPLANPAAARVIAQPEASERGCHDIAVHVGIKRAAGACRPEAVMWDISDPAHPIRLYGFTQPNVAGWHSGSFTWDGQVAIFGHEPGGGAQPRCRATDRETDSSLFFHRVADGELLGTWAFNLRHPQTNAENCTVHNYNVVPVEDRYILVSSYYQGGTNVVDFTLPWAAQEIAFFDPAPLVPTQLGGEWSSYWYNGFLYASDITKGVTVYALASEATEEAVTLKRLNPQTQEGFLEDDEDDGED